MDGLEEPLKVECVDKGNITVESEDRRGVPEAQECTPQEGEKEILQGVEAEE